MPPAAPITAPADPADLTALPSGPASLRRQVPAGVWRPGVAWNGAALLAASAALLLAWDLTGWDLAVSRWFGSAQGFSWRGVWWASEVMHGQARWLGWAVFAALLINVWWPWSFARALSRRERWRWVVVTVACALLIPLLKRASLTSCPWSLAEFGGGAAQFVPHWMLGVRDGGSGGCFPSGHASTAFAFVGGWFALRGQAPRAARVWLAVTLLAGVVLGAVQVMRGAHYVSHPLWTAWFSVSLAWAADVWARL